MKIFLDNVDLSSTSGPNHFGKKLKKNLESFGHVCEIMPNNPDVQLSFIQTNNQALHAPLVLRLDGVYFDTDCDFMSRNRNIVESYKEASGVVFQSNYCKELIFKFFGEHENYEIIHNGADLDYIEKIQPMQGAEVEKYNNIWCCASSWYYGNDPSTPRKWKRLKENIEFFLQYAPNTDCLVVAGNVYTQDVVHNERIFYIGRLSTEDLFSLFKTSKYFIHLASPDACPNVVVDARASGCKVICSSLGGAKEIAGPDALVIQEEDWDYSPMKLNGTRPLDLTNITANCYNVPMDMRIVARQYETLLKQCCK